VPGWTRNVTEISGLEEYGDKGQIISSKYVKRRWRLAAPTATIYHIYLPWWMTEK
jgi:hypothetical protein